MTTLRDFKGLRFARLLTLVGLLCVAGLQLHEAGHWQETGDSATHCLVCKSASGIIVDTAAAVQAAITIAVPPPVYSSEQLPSAARSGFHARGPPNHS